MRWIVVFNNAEHSSMLEVCEKVKFHLPTITYRVRPQIKYDTILNAQNHIFDQPPLTQVFNK